MRNLSKAAAIVAILACVPMAAVAGASPQREGSDLSRSKAGNQAVVSAMQALANTGIAKLNAEDYAGAAVIFKQGVDDPHFGELPPGMQFAFFQLLALSEKGSDQLDAAFGHMQQAGVIAPDRRDATYWLQLCSVALQLKKNDVAVDALTAAARDFPNDVDGINIEFINTTVNRASTLGDTGRYRGLLEALWAARYRSHDDFQPADGLWFQLFKVYADAGLDDKARALIPEFAGSYYAIAVNIDNRYRRFATAQPARFDIAAAVKKDLEHDQALARQHPDDLSGVQRVASDLKYSGQLPQALKLLDDALAKIAAAPAGKPAFRNVDDQLHWVHNERSRVLALMGRWEESEAAQKTARDASLAAGDDLVSQVINLAGRYYVEGKPQQALDTLKDLDPKNSSAYGLMSVAEPQVCAYAQLGDKVHLDETLTYMRDHAEDGFAPLVSALQCTGDVDSVAAAVIKQLDDPETRLSVLTVLQDYVADPAPTPISARMDSVWAAVKARPDVKAAVDRYGVILAIPTYAPTH